MSLRATRIKEARKLHEQGWSNARLVEYFGIQPATVRRWLDPKFDESESLKNKARKDSYRGKCVICGGWTSGSRGPGKAPKYCGDHFQLNPDRPLPKEVWPKERIIRAIKDWEKIHGDPPAMTDWNSHQARKLGDEKRARYFEQNRDLWPWFSHVAKKFGSWNAAIAAAGFEPRPPHGTFETGQKLKTRMRIKDEKHQARKYWTRELILKRMQEWHTLYGEPPTSTAWLLPVEIVDGLRIWPSTGAVQKEFGSWSRGMRAAGFKPRQEKKVIVVDQKNKRPQHPARNWTKEEIIEIFRAWVEEHRIPPSKSEWSSLPERPSPSTVIAMFGSWNEAIKAAGYPPRPVGITAEAVRKLLPLPRTR